MNTSADKRDLVKEAYASVARQQSSCCGSKKSCCGGGPVVPDHPVPEAELGLSCGNPVAFLQVREGDVVLDLGSGAGKDVFLAAQKVGPSGRSIGVDMTPEMLALARRNAEKFRAATGLANVEFREGMIESLPLADGSVDVAISNCVINLSPDKQAVFDEIWRVLKPGGRMVVSDIVLNRPLPKEALEDAALYAGCIAGALRREQYLGAVQKAGFPSVEILTDRVYLPDSSCSDPVTADLKQALTGAASSMTILAVKPACGGES